MFDPLVVDAIGRTAEGYEIARFSLRNTAGLRADVMTYGATLMRLETPDRNGSSQNVVLGFDHLEPYLIGTPCFGAIVGRYANRIAGARFALDSVAYKLAANDGANHLHGGVRGFDKAVWDAEAVMRDGDPGVLLRYVSRDGEEGYPGELSVETLYLLRRDRLVIAFEARTRTTTHVNLTHHSYFNLSGGARDIGAHDLEIEANKYLAVDPELIPLDARDVGGTPFDFRQPHRIGARINAANEQLQIAGGYDHTFVLNGAGGLTRTAALSDAVSGRRMTLWTTAPGVQLYTGNNLDGSVGGFGRRSGICLEPQHFPDSPNRPDFPSTVLRPGEVYEARSELVFDLAS